MKTLDKVLVGIVLLFTLGLGQAQQALQPGLAQGATSSLLVQCIEGCDNWKEISYVGNPAAVEEACSIPTVVQIKLGEQVVTCFENICPDGTERCP